jgi:uncharacterized membrane protein
MKEIKTYQILILTIIFIGYLLLRFWNLTDACLFFDEIFSLHAAAHSWPEMFRFVAQDLIHPPLFYVLLKIWISLGGESLFWVRLFPAVFSIAALVPLFLLCRELKLEFWSTVLVLTLFAVNGALIKYAQEVRMYSVLLCFGLFSIWLFVRFLSQNKGFGWLILVNILLVNTHYFGWLIVAAEGLAVLLLERDKLKQFILMSGAAFLSFLPWTFEVWQAAQVNADFRQNLGWAARPGLSALYHFVNDLFEPFYFQQTTADRAETIFITAPLIFICLVSTLIYFPNWKTVTEKKQILLLLILLKTPILLAFIASWLLPVSVWGTRHLIIAFPLLLIFFAIVLESLRIRELKTTFIVIILFFTGLAFVMQLMRGSQKLVWCAWEELAADLEQNKTSEQVRLYVFEDLIAYHVWSALRAKQNVTITLIKDVEGLAEDKAYFLPRGFDQIKVTNENGLDGERFYVAFRAADFNEYHPPLSNLRAKGYRVGEPKIFEAQKIKTFLVEIER